MESNWLLSTSYVETLNQSFQHKQLADLNSLTYDTNSNTTIWFNNIPLLGFLEDFTIIAKIEIVGSNGASAIDGNNVSLSDVSTSLVDQFEVMFNNVIVNNPSTTKAFFSIKAQQKKHADESRLDVEIPLSNPTVVDKTRAVEDIKLERTSRAAKLGNIPNNFPNEKYLIFSLKEAMLMEGNQVPLFALNQFSVNIRLRGGCVVKTDPAVDHTAGAAIGVAGTSTTVGAQIKLTEVEGCLNYYTVSDDQIRVYREQARQVEESGATAYGMSFMTRWVTSFSDKISGNTYTRSIPLGG